MTGNGHAGGHPRQLGIIGYPVEQSLSPVMHNEAFRQQRMNCVYGAFAVEPANLGVALAGLRALGFLGVNVTIPHKESVIPYLDEVAPMASQVGAVNTIVNRNGRLVGYNTDGWGFIASLEESGVKCKGLRAVILGAGGAARAIVAYLTMAGAGKLTVSNRTLERAEGVLAAVAATGGHTILQAVSVGTELERQALSEADLVVNCTPLGMQPANVEQSPLPLIHLLPAAAVVYDTVYRPAQTRLLREADDRGLRTVGGLGMLVHQGACSWEYWFGRRGPVGVMLNAAHLAMGGEG